MSAVHNENKIVVPFSAIVFLTALVLVILDLKLNIDFGIITFLAWIIAIGGFSVIIIYLIVWIIELIRG